MVQVRLARASVFSLVFALACNGGESSEGTFGGSFTGPSTTVGDGDGDTTGGDGDGDPTGDGDGDPTGDGDGDGDTGGGEPGCGNGPAPGDWCPVPPMTRPSGAGPWGIVGTDFDGDGNRDLAVALRNADAVMVHYGNGMGGLSAGDMYNVGPGPAGVAIADFDGNGQPDLVSSDYGGTSVTALINTGPGFTFGATKAVLPSPAFVVARDFNSDGRVDIAVSHELNMDGQVSVLMNTGTSLADAAQFPTGHEPLGIATGDFNGDGHEDVAVGNFGASTLSTLWGIGDGTFNPGGTFNTTTGLEAIIAVDLDIDGDLDLAGVGRNSPTVEVLLSNGMGGFAQQEPLAIGGEPHGLTAVDLNNDGAPDLAVTDAAGNQIFVIGNDV